MKKTISSLIVILTLTFFFNSLTLFPAAAAEEISGENKLVIHYYAQKNGVEQPLAGAGIELFRVAEMKKSNGGVTYSLLSEYDSLRETEGGEDVTFKQLTVDHFMELAKSINAIASSPDAFCTTDSRGMASFGELAEGMYLVRQKSSAGISADYDFFDPYLISVPYPKNEDGKVTWTEEVLSEPKTRLKTNDEESSKQVSGEESGNNQPSGEESSTQSSEREFVSSQTGITEASGSSSEVSSGNTEVSSGENNLVDTGDTQAWLFAAFAVFASGLLSVIFSVRSRKEEKE